MNNTHSSNASEPNKDVSIDESSQQTDTPSERQAESEQREQETEQEIETTSEELISEVDDLLGEEKEEEIKEPKKEDHWTKESAKADFKVKDEGIRLDAQLLQQKGKSNLEIVREIINEGAYLPEQINRLKKLLANGSLNEEPQSQEAHNPIDEREKFRQWQAEESQKTEKKSAIEWFTKEFVKELGINTNNSVAVESRKKIMLEAKKIHSQTSPEHRNFKKSLELAAAYHGLTDKAKVQEKIQKAVKMSRTAIDDTGKPQKIKKDSVTYSELSEIRQKDKARAVQIARDAREGKIKLVNDLT